VNQDISQEIARRIRSFPSMPKAALRILRLLEDPNASPREVEALLRQEPSLTANILRMTNSAFFGLSCTVGSVRQALALLGWKRLSQLVLASCVRATMDKAVPGYDLPAGDLWRHAVMVSVAAEGLVKELNLTGGDDVFTAALLHDMGKLVLGAYVRDALPKIEALAADAVPFEEAETRVLGTNHAEVGAEVLKRWSLPPQIVEAVRWHHAPEGGGRTTVLIDAVHIADMLCVLVGIGGGREGLRHLPSSGARKRLGLSAGALERVASHALALARELTATI